MPSREEYNTCMKPYISGKDLTKDERRLNFCVGAKVCSGKAANQEEARHICSLPAEPSASKPQTRRSRAGSCEKEITKVAACVATSLEMGEPGTLPARLEAAIAGCLTSKPAAPPTYRRFMSRCLKQNGAGGDFIHSQAELKNCQAQWNEIRGS